MDCQTVGMFVKDWIPSVGIMAGAIWVLFNWFHGETLRQQKERSAVEGELTFQLISLSESKCLLLFNACWNNKSPLPFKSDVNKTRFDIIKVDNDIPLGNLELHTENEAKGQKTVVECKPFAMRKSFILEPNTQSNYQRMVVLEKGFVYIARFKLFRDSMNGRFGRSRLCICDLR